MHKVQTAILAAAALTFWLDATASAADLTRPVYKAAPAPVLAATWSGFYAGLNLGYGWGHARVDEVGLPFPNFNEGPLSFNHDPRGWLGGVQLGYNWQLDRWLLGIETDIDKTGMSGDATVGPLPVVVGAPFPGSFQAGHEDIQWLGTLRGRAGFLATDNLLLYGTGGLAYARVGISELTNTVPGVPFATFLATQSGWQVGWAAGVGAEWAFAPKWSTKVEYLHVDLGSTTLIGNRVVPNPGNPGFTTQNVVNTTADIVRLGLNYRFF